MKPRKWKTIATDVVYETPIFDVHRRRAKHPHRGERNFYVLDAGPWVNIIPLTPENQVVMIRQWRHGIADFTLEVPGGMVDKTDPTPKHAARREMIEETGYDSRRISELGQVHPNPAILGNICFSFLAREVHQVLRPAENGAEETIVEFVPLSSIPQLIASRKIMHALTIAAFSFLHVYNPRHRAKL